MKRSVFVWRLAFVLSCFSGALQSNSFESYRSTPLAIPAQGRTGFTEIQAAISGVNFTNRLADERSTTNQIFFNGSGVAAGDIDGDGWCDLYFCGLDSPNALYRNLGGWRFEDVTARAGVALADQASTGAALADVDGDGDLDLLVNAIARGTRLFLNDGKGRFLEVTDQAGLRSTSGSASLALADVDGDGRLDLYVVNYRNDTLRDMPETRFRVNLTNGVYQLLSVNGRPATAPDLAGRFSFDRAGGVLENGEADAFFRNLGDGRFARVNWTDGTFRDEQGAPIAIPYDWGLSAMFRDLNGDGAPDLYVCNDFQSPDRIWINDGQGRFRAVARPAFRQTSLFSMGLDFADIDRDGFDDLFVADMLSRDHARRHVQVMDAMAFAQYRNTSDDRPQFSRNMLFRNRGNGTFAELAQLAGVDASDWTWCPAFLDVDLDGYEDLLLTTGHWRDAQHVDIAREIETAKTRKPMSVLEQLRLRLRFPRLDTPNFAFRNRGDLTFTEVGASWGFASRRISQGMALADLDNDGDLDVVINCLNDGPLLCRNDSNAARVAIRLRGQPPNTRGVGSKVRVLAPGLPAQSQEFISGGRYLSCDDGLRAFAAGNATNRLRLEITWRSGRRSVVPDATPNQLYEMFEPGAASESPVPPPDSRPSSVAPRPFFQDLSPLLSHIHADEPFDDFHRQALLPRQLSSLGPGVSWFDFNGDGWDDLLVGAGRGGRLAVFRNDGQGGFVRQRAKLLEPPADRDLTTILGWQPAAGQSALLLGVDNYDVPATNAPALRSISLVTGEQDDQLLRWAASTGPLALADIDGDGDLDLFVGGRVRAGRYPEFTTSALLRNELGQFRFDATASATFQDVGMVSGAVFTDLNGDRRPDLVVGCDWGPVKIFRNEDGRLVAWKMPLAVTAGLPHLTPRITQLNEMSGWWNSVAAGDFDGDGRFDLAMGNWGRNTPRQRFLAQPIRLFQGDADGSGNLALLETHLDPDLRQLVPVRDWASVSSVFPALRERFPTFAAFSTARVPEVLAAGLPAMHEVSAATLDSVVLLNRGDHFEVRPLPTEAQVSPVFGLAAGDFDGDGSEDLFLAQNFFGVASSESRQDAGWGLWLRGDGRGGFAAVPSAESGLEISGEGRGAAVSDFDHDGRLDLAVGQYRGPTRLYRNVRARPGLRVRLQGSVHNPAAIGTVVRGVARGGMFGAVHEIRLGGGYWSQDSATLVVATGEELEALEIRWAGGPTERVALSSGQLEFSRSQPAGSR